MNEDVNYISAAEAAEMVGVTKETIRNLCKAGTLRYERRNQFFYPCKQDVELHFQSIKEIHEIERSIEDYKQKIEITNDQLRKAQADMQERLEAMTMFPQRIKCITSLLCAIIPHFDNRLTSREIEIAMELLQGGKMSEVAQKLQLTPARTLTIYGKIVDVLSFYPIDQASKDETIKEQQKLIESQAKKIMELVDEYGVENAPYTPEKRALLDTPIRKIDLPTRVYRGLEYANIETVRDMVRTPRHYLLCLRNFGKKSVEEIDQWLANHDLAFDKP